MENKLPTIGFLGSGAITTALVTGLCERAADAPYPLVVSDAKAEACEKLRARFPGRVTAAATLQECVDQSDWIVIAVWPVSLGAAGIVLGIVASVVCFFAGLVIAAVCIMIAGVAVAGMGIALFVIPPAAMIVTGVGLLLFAVGLAATVGTVKLCILVYPAMIRGFVNLCRRPFYGKAV